MKGHSVHNCYSSYGDSEVVYDYYAFLNIRKRLKKIIGWRTTNKKKNTKIQKYKIEQKIQNAKWRKKKQNNKQKNLITMYVLTFSNQDDKYTRENQYLWHDEQKMWPVRENEFSVMFIIYCMFWLYHFNVTW